MLVCRKVTMTICKVLVVCALSASIAYCEDQPSFIVRGLGGKTVVLTEADLARLPQHSVTTTDHGVAATFQGVLLTDVLALVDLPVGDKFHSTAASYYVLAQGKDGYRVVFAWAELDATFMDKPIYVAARRDNKPLPENARPFQLVVPGEKRGGRWLRQLATVTVKQAN